MTTAPAPLEELVAFAERIGARCWIGETPSGDPLARARSIAANLDYPSVRPIGSDHDPVAELRRRADQPPPP